MQRKTVELIDVAILFAKKKYKIITILVISVVIGLIVAFTWELKYRSSLTYIVTDGNSINFSSGGLLNGLANLSVQGTTINAEQTLLILRSTDLLDNIIAKFNLDKVYESEIQEEVRKKLSDNFEIVEYREGGIGFNSIIAISIDIIDTEPERAFSMINYIYSSLDSVVTEMNKKGIEEGYLMLEQRLRQNQKDLYNAEVALLNFQNENGIIEVTEQASSLISNLATLKAEIVKFEVQLNYYERVYGKDSPNYNDLLFQRDELQNQYDILINDTELNDTSFNLFPKLENIPELSINYFRLIRDLEVQQEIYKVLYPQYEQQKLNYSESNSGIKLIDSANYPTYKDSPKRAYILIAFFLLGTLVSIFTVLIGFYFSQLASNEPTKYEKFTELIENLKP